ncbi:MAG: sugar phosphate isomerase/epimerase family protein [Pirellulales bacterium]|jgi:sugar phosphate isomerase/epimerase|nr:sugar phosphate isomerase/epimerase family protein [Pirellulales bacterium]
MIQACVTISLVEQARGGPFVFWGDLEIAFRAAKQARFDAVEIFAPSAESLAQLPLSGLLEAEGLKLAALGTGAGWVLHRRHLVSPQAAERREAEAFIRAIIDKAGEFGAMAIIGSMQGHFGAEVDRTAALAYLAGSLDRLGEHAGQYGVPLLFEPLNRYETNLLHTLGDAGDLLDSMASDNVRLLADLFHMNIEEQDIASALTAAAAKIGHIHFVDSNRHAAGLGHLEYEPIAAALKQIGYSGYLSAEALPLPNSEQAALETMATFRKYF